MTKAPISTLILVVFAGALAAIGLQSNHELTMTEVAKSVAAVAATVLFLKTAFMFFAFRIFNNCAFKGSFFLVAILIAPLLVLALLLGESVASPRIDNLPKEEVPVLLLGFYALIIAFLSGAFRVSHWFFGLFTRKGSTTR